MAGYIERLKKLLGWFKGSKLHPPIATKVIDGDAEGDFITLSDKQVKDIQGTNNQPSNAPWTADPAEIHIGLDFGTSYTKACLYFLDKDQRHVVRWNTSWGSEKGYFLPSRLWLDSDNVLHMVMPSAKQSREIRYICLMSTEFPWNYHKDFPIVINRNSLVSSSTCMAGGLAKHLLPQAEGQLQPLSLVLPWQARVAA